jgi:hypothetical protein
MIPSERVAHTADDIRDLLSGSMDECALALGRGDISDAQRHLQESMEQLRRIRRDLRE